MFKKLRYRLTLLCSVVTAFVLLVVSGLALNFALARLGMQAEQEFKGTLNSIFLYLQGQSTIDSLWLAKTEEANDLILHVESSGVALQYATREKENMELVEQVKNLAKKEFGYQPDRGMKSSIEPENIFFAFHQGEVEYRAVVSKIPYKEGFLEVVALKDRTAEKAAAIGLVALVVVVVLAGIGALVIFAYLFAGKAIRPVEEAHTRQTEFISAASHELRSPLAVMQLSIDTIRVEPDNTQLYLGKMERESARMSRLITDLLLLATMDSGKVGLQLSWASPKTILLTAYERFERIGTEKGISIGIQLPDTLPPTICCDEYRIEQVLAILLDNAIHYAGTGEKILLGIELTKNKLGFVVEDSGPGIPDEKKARVFERFYRADQARSKKEHYGLGLAVAREIARMHKGEMLLEDSSLGGAKFTLLLPLD